MVLLDQQTKSSEVEVSLKSKSVALKPNVEKIAASCYSTGTCYGPVMKDKLWM